MRNRTMEDYLERVHADNERLRAKIEEKDAIVRHTIRSAVQNKITAQDSQRVIDRARAVAASWEQHACGGDPITSTFVILGMKRLIEAIDAMDADAITSSSSPVGDEDG